MLRIGLDCDDTCNYWYSEYLKRFGKPKNSYTITRHVEKDLIDDKEFWMNLPVKHIPDFNVTLYCTKRIIPKSWTKRWLEDHNYPIAPIYQVISQYKNKASVIKLPRHLKCKEIDGISNSYSRFVCVKSNVPRIIQLSSK